jgi:hypothetical protein
LALATCIFTIASAQDHPAANLPVPRSSLTDAEYARALQIAEPRALIGSPSQLHPDAVSSRTGANRVVVTDVQAVASDKPDAASSRLAVVTLYQYEGNVTVNRLVDLNTGTVVEEDRMPNAGARFTNVELEYARQLLMADERIQRLVTPVQGATFNFLLATTPDPSSPLYGKRVVNVLINTPDGYLTELPRISVNLTDAAVIVQPQP